MILILTAICGEISAQQDVVQGASDLSKYILTPKAAPTPRINGARIFGVRPGSEFLFTIAATGIRPMIFSAEGLPRGLKLNPATGRITGRVKKTGEYTVRLSAENALGRPTDGLEQLELLGTRRHTGTDTFFGTRNG